MKRTIDVYDAQGHAAGQKRLTIGEAARLAGFPVTDAKPVDADPGGPRLWLALQTESGRETLAAAQLIARRLNCYLPAIAFYAQRGRACQWRTAPLFRGYLFLRVPQAAAAAHVARARAAAGVLDVMRGNGRAAESGYAIVPEADIRHCREVETRSFERKAAAQRKQRGPYDGPLKIGDAVRVGVGPLEGWAGIIEKLTDSERVLVLMDILGRATHVTLPARALEGA